MEDIKDIKKQTTILNGIKWLCFPLGIAMYWIAGASFGETIGIALGTLASVAFFVICDQSSKRIICEYVADDLTKAVKSAGHKECVVEIKSLKVGLITRVYLIGAKEKAPLCSKAVIQRISKSWYRDKVWITQLVDLGDESEIKEAQRALNEDLLDDVKKKKDDKN